jgi:tetratricopeptide (TPR) repeat protein
MIFLLAALLWQSDSNTAFAQAKQQHKLVLVEYVQAPCPKCVDVEHLADKDPALKAALSNYVLLRVDLAKTSIPAQYRYTPPAYVVFDADKHERMRIHETNGVMHAEDWHFAPQSFSEPIEGIAASAPAFVQAAELVDAKRDLEANVLLATTYHRLKMTEHARAAFAEVEKIAQRQGNAAMAQSAKVQSAYTYVTDGRAAHAVELLKPLAKTPVNRDIEALTWLTLGHAYEAATDKKQAVEAFRRAQSLSPSESRTYKEAGAALKRLE